VSDPFAGEPVLFFDGGCGLCHRAVRALLRLDRRGRLRFAPLGGETFRARVPTAAHAALPDSLVLVTGNDPPLVRSAAILEALRIAGLPGRAVVPLAALVPTALADRLYDRLARSRRRLFAAPADACPVPPGPDRARFLA
jgi:predicted DCC family thiol-disulfide oxidoreductase YuxK